MVKKSEQDKYIEKMTRGTQRRLDNPDYCGLCGKDLTIDTDYTGDYTQEQWEWVAQTKVHISCAQRKIAAIRRKQQGK